MVEQKFSLELTKNGVQQTIHAKEGEAHARALKITFTVKGEVIPITGYAVTAYFEDGTHQNLTNSGNPLTFEIPAGLCESPGEKLVEIQFTRNEGTEKVYSPQFRVTVEDSIGATAEGGAIGDPTQFEKLLASDTEVQSPTVSARVPVVESDATKLVPASYFASASEVSDLADDVSDIDSRLTTAESDIDDAEDAITDLSGRMSTAEGDIGNKVDKVSGKGLSTNDYDATEKANVAANTLARHTHSNKTVLDKFGESSGEPTYDGNPIGGGGGAVDDIVNSYDVSLLDENKVAHIKTGEMYEIFDKTERGINYIKDTPLNIYDLWHDGVKLCYQGLEITCVIRGDSNTIPYYMYFINGGMGDIPYLSRAELKADKSVGNISLIRYFAEREYTAAKDNKLSGIAANAQVNVLEKVKDSNGNELTITNKAVTLPAIPAAQIQSDWEQSDNTAKDYIKNKPSIPAAQVQADWNESDNTKADYIKNKPTIPDISGKEDTANKVTSLSSSSTDTEYPSAKAVYDELQNIPSMPSGTNAGDILEWDGDEWVSKPKWQMIYQPVEYIQSSGTQYIDTGVPITSDLRMVLERANVNTGDCIEGALYNVGGTISSFSWGTNGATSYNFGSLVGSNTSVWGASNVPADTNKHTVDMSSGSQKLDGVEYATQTIVANAVTIGLFAWHAGGNFNTRYSTKVYSCKFYNGATLIRDYIPVRNVFTGKGGLYDLVNGKCYENDGTGNFVIGADVN